MAGQGESFFGRRCRLLVRKKVEEEIARTKRTTTVETTTDDLEIKGGDGGLRIQFSIKKTIKKEPNSCEIRVTNLSPDSRAFLQQIGVRAFLEAGYKDTGLERIFTGDVRVVDHMREGADWVSVIKLDDGGRGWQFGRINESFAAKTPIADVVKKIADAMGLDTGTIERQFDVAQMNSSRNVPTVLDHGWAASGSASRAMDHVMKAAKLHWSIQDCQLQILAEEQSLDNTIPDITPQSGLIGSPEMGTPPKKTKPSKSGKKKKHKPQLLKFDALLTPVKPGEKVRLKSERYDGDVRVYGVEFVGDTHGGDWYSRIAATTV